MLLNAPLTFEQRVISGNSKLLSAAGRLYLHLQHCAWAWST